MKNVAVYEDVFNGDQLSIGKLQATLTAYQQDAQQAEEEARKSGLTGDDLSDVFFNSLDEIKLFSFETATQHIDVYLGRFHDYEEEGDASELGVCYLIEERNLDLELENADDYSLGQETDFIQALQKLGYQE